MTASLTLIALASIAFLFTGVYLDHRQACRKKRRQLLATVVATVRRQHLEEGWRAMGGSGGRR